MHAGTRPIKILLAADQRVFAQHLRRLVEGKATYDVIGEASTGPDAVRLAHQRVPDVLLLDFSTPSNNAMETLLELGESSTRIRPVLLTSNLDRVQTVRALQLGARAVLLREQASATLDEAIGAVAAGQYWIGRSTAGDLMSMLKRLGADTPTATRRPFGLTPQQLEITRAIAAGLGNPEIAQKLGLSEEAVKRDVTHILTKTGASTRLELAMLAIRHDLLHPR